MVLPGMHLFLQPADYRFVRPYNHKDVFTVKTHLLESGNYLHMSQPLLIGTHLVLTFYDIDTILFKNPICLSTRLDIHLGHGIVILCCLCLFITNT